MTTFIDIHVLRSFPPSNLNRDENKSPKTAIFGGVQRLRISSQCLKRTLRTSKYFTSCFSKEELGIRTSQLPSLILKKFESETEPFKKGLSLVLKNIGKNTNGDNESMEGNGDEDSSSDESTDDELSNVDKKKGKRSKAKTPSKSKEDVTKQLLYLSQAEITLVIDWATNNKEELTKLGSASNKNSQAELRKSLTTSLSYAKDSAVDVGMFGRFNTSSEFDVINGAVQVAHAIGTQKYTVDYDFFTAVDDLSTTTVAGHLGEVELSSSVMYLFACCDLDQLEKNLGSRTKDGRNATEESKNLARMAISSFIKAFLQSTPTGKKTSTAPHTPAEYVEVIIRQTDPVSFANAFISPVSSFDCAKNGAMSESIHKLISYRNKLENAYGSTHSHRFVLSLHDLEESTDVVNSLEDLTEKLTAAIRG